MFSGAFLLIFTGYPVAFALAGTALLFMVFGMIAGDFDPILMRAMTERAFGTMSNYTLLAVPFFIFMGIVLEKSKLAEQLLETIGVLFGRVRGGLALGVIFVGALLAAATGVAGASVTALTPTTCGSLCVVGFASTASAIAWKSWPSCSPRKAGASNRTGAIDWQSHWVRSASIFIPSWRCARSWRR